MKKLLIICFLSGIAIANMKFTKNEECKTCHPVISAEYSKSQHANATIFKDKIHGAVYKSHPQYKKLKKYRCANCHTPTADNKEALLTSHNGITPEQNNTTQIEAVACAYCHRITDVKHGVAMNKNIISPKEKVFFTRKEKHGVSSFHGLETNKEIFENGKMCMGCHSHKANKKEFNVCSTNFKVKPTDKDCIACHMHKVAGAPNTESNAKEHTFHGFPGLHGDLSNLSQYVTLDIHKDSAEAFTVSIKHDVPHASTLHPVRFSLLKVSILRAGEVIKLEPVKIFKKIGSKGKPTPPWLATEIIHNTTLAANSTTKYPFKQTLKSGDVITAKFGYMLIIPKALKKFGLENNEEAKKYRVISEKTFTIK